MPARGAYVAPDGTDGGPGGADAADAAGVQRAAFGVGPAEDAVELLGHHSDQYEYMTVQDTNYAFIMYN